MMCFNANAQLHRAKMWQLISATALSTHSRAAHTEVSAICPLLPVKWGDISFPTIPQKGRLGATPHGSLAWHQHWVLPLYLHIEEVGLQQSGARVAGEEKHQLGLLQVARGQRLLHVPQGQGKACTQQPGCLGLSA